MIIGIGMDLLQIERIRRSLARPSAERFMERLLTAAEREQAARRQGRLAEFVAGRFAAKEAVSKAFGCGIGTSLSFQDIEVLSGDNGKPVCIVSEQALKRLELPAGVVVHLSITHTSEQAAAYAVAEHRQQSDTR